MNINRNIKEFAKSFKYAFSGIIHCIKNERNMRFHFCAAFYVLIFMRFYDLKTYEKASVYIMIGLVIALEALNTAIEAIVDLVSPDQQKLAKIAKDCSAGAVLAAAFSAVAIAYLYFWDTKVFLKIAGYFGKHILSLILLVISVIVWVILIFVPGNKRKENKNG